MTTMLELTPDSPPGPTPFYPPLFGTIHYPFRKVCPMCDPDRLIQDANNITVCKVPSGIGQDEIADRIVEALNLYGCG